MCRLVHTCAHAETQGRGGRGEDRTDRSGWLAEVGIPGRRGGPTLEESSLSLCRQGPRACLLAQTLCLCPPAPAHSAGLVQERDLSCHLTVCGLEFGLVISCSCSLDFFLFSESHQHICSQGGVLCVTWGLGILWDLSSSIKSCAPGPSLRQGPGSHPAPVWPSEALRHMLVAHDVLLLGPQLMCGSVDRSS